MSTGKIWNPDPLPLITTLAEATDDIERYATDAIHGERWPLIRLGERERIPAIARRLIFERDGKCCLACGIPLTLAAARLDHIVPWSAGGPDTSDNLRVLCDPCNTDRSNFRTGLDDHAARRPPVARICITCAWQSEWDDEDIELPELVPAYCGQCGIVSPTWLWQLY